MAEITKDEITELVLSEFAEHDIVDVVFRWNMNKTRLGVAKFQKDWWGNRTPVALELSELLFDALDDKWTMVNTVYHELGHIVAVRDFGNRGWGHGHVWKRVATDLGCNVDRPCGRLDKEVMDYKYTAHCDCGRMKEFGFHKLGSNWKNTLNGNMRRYYTCPKCDSRLKVRQNY